MERRRPIALVTLLLGTLAIAATAGIYADRSAPGFGGGPTGGDAAAGGIDQVGLPGWLVENFLAVLLTASALAILVGAAVLVWLRGREGLEAVVRFFARNLLAGVLVLLFLVGVRLFLEFVGTEQTRVPGAGGSGAGTPGAGAGGSGAAGASGESIPPMVILVVAVAILGLVAYLALQRGGSDGGATGGHTRKAPPDDADSGSDGPAVNIDDVPQSNAVYRAWRQMATQAVDARDRTVTASEVARTAVRRGFDREAVRTLTDLFEEVRYGDRPVTEDRERRAQAALQSVEDTGEGRS